METPSKKYASAGTPAVVKEYRAELALALEGLGVPLKTFLEANNKTSHAVSKSTLYEHVAALRKGDTPLSAEKKTGNRAKLSAEQWEVVAGAILSSEEEANIRWILDFIEANFDVVPSSRTCPVT